MTSLRPVASSESIPVSLLRTSERKRSGTVVSVSVPWMLSSSDISSVILSEAKDLQLYREMFASGEVVAVHGEILRCAQDKESQRCRTRGVLHGGDAHRVLRRRFH